MSDAPADAEADPEESDDGAVAGPREDRFPRIAATLAGLWMVVAFFGLDQAYTGTKIQFYPPWHRNGAGELMVWLGSVVLLTPGAFLLGWGLAPMLRARLARVLERVDGATERKLRLGVLALYGVAFAVALAGRHLLLADQPITDDENAARFGGRILATGHLAIPRFPVFHAFFSAYLFGRNGLITSFDWLGVQLTWALGELTGTGSLPFTLAAAVPTAALAYVAGRRFGPRWGLVAGLFYLVSPMGLTLSWTSHAHLLSRAALALMLAATVDEVKTRSPRRWAAFGLTLGLAFLARPVESAALSAPWVLSQAWAAQRAGVLRRGLLWSLLGAAGPLAIFFGHNLALTGSLRPARFAANEIPMPHFRGALESFSDPALLWKRFGSNAGLNTFRLMVWFWGPVGAVAAALGVARRPELRPLAVGIGLQLCTGLIHDDSGIHAVGPIHMTECAILGTVLAVGGLSSLFDRPPSVRWGDRAVGLAFVGLVGLPAFALFHGQAMGRMAHVQKAVYDLLERDTDGPSFVMAQEFYQVWMRMEDLADTGTWVLYWRYPTPAMTEKVIVIRHRFENLDELAEAYPSRSVYHLVYTGQAPDYWRVDLVAGPRP